MHHPRKALLFILCLVRGLQVRVENLEDATEHIGEVLSRVKREYLTRAYKVKEW